MNENEPPTPIELVLPETLPVYVSALIVGAAGVDGIPSAVRVAAAGAPKKIGYCGGAKVTPPASPVNSLLLVVP